MTVLVVEDDHITLEFLSLLLEAEGIQVLRAAGGVEALELARNTRLDAVLCDLHMARVTGLDVLRGLQEEPRTAGTPVVMITADQSPELRKQCLDHGARAFVIKPFDPDFLIDTLRRIAGDDVAAAARVN